MKEGGEIIDLLDRGIIKDLRFSSTSFTNDGSGKLMLGLAFVMAKEYTDRRAADMKRTTKNKTLEGRYVSGHKKPGYYKDVHQHLHPDGPNWIVLHKALHMRLAGKRLNEIAKFLLDEGFPFRTEHTPEPKKVVIDDNWVSGFLVDPIYCGVLRYGKTLKNLIDQDSFVPMLTPDEFEQICKSSKTRSRDIERLVSFAKEGRQADLMNGMVICGGCNKPRRASITPKVNKKTLEVTRYYYYPCRTPGCPYFNKSLRAKVVLDAAKTFLHKHPIANSKSYARHVKEMERLTAEADKEHVFKIQTLETQKRAAEESMRSMKAYILKLKEGEGDRLVERMYRDDLKAKKIELDGIVKNLEVTRALRDNAKTAIVAYEKFVKLFQNIAKVIDEKAGMRDLDFIMRKLFTNFTVNRREVTKIEQNSPFRELNEIKTAAHDEQPLLVTPGRVELPLQA